MASRKEKGTNDYSGYSYISADIIKKAVKGETEAIDTIIGKYKGYTNKTIRRIGTEDNTKTNTALLEDIEQTVWEGVIKDIRKFK